MVGEIQEESGDFMVDQKSRSVLLTAEGIRKAESYFGVEDLSAPDMTELNHYIKQALTAHSLFTRDKEYIVTDDEQVMIVDQFTGRIMPGRRYSDGLHQAIEAKEGVSIKEEDKTIATITYQNYFRMFSKLAGMTGTAMTEEDEFRSIYALDVVEIPTNRPLIREDMKDVIFITLDEKLKGIVEEIKQVHESGQPILVGTASVEMSEIVSRLITREGIKHEVLNAKHHMREAEIVAQAGKFGNVTIATNMAGRGTDILLGGNPDFLAKRDLRNSGMDDAMIENATAFFETDDPEILEARRKYKELHDMHKVTTDAEHDRVVSVGGLYILGTERHESRRIDNQLRGRAGRQGDPGKTRFFISFQDEVMVRFGGETMERTVARLKAAGEIGGLETGITTKLIESAQKRIEAYNFDMRKHVLEFDDVMNHMRTIIYSQRSKVLKGADLHEDICSMISETVSSTVFDLCNGDTSLLDHDALKGAINSAFCFEPDLSEITQKTTLDVIINKITEQAYDVYDKLVEDMNRQFAELGETDLTMSEVERTTLLRAVDSNWMEHIDIMDQLRQGIGLRAYANTEPIVAYREEGFALFDSMIADIRTTTVRRLFHYRGATIQRKQVTRETHEGATHRMNAQNAGTEKKKPHKTETKVGRNDPCPCGSGKKYKQCCGKNINE
ncbi:MAG: SEC-C domain-containing protein, partial [Clostridia bacterium]|nr:SEC-C domain-containing protein [Clostridia bacterium]